MLKKRFETRLAALHTQNTTAQAITQVSKNVDKLSL